MTRKTRARAAKRRKMKTPKGISRIDIADQGTHGFMVRLCRQGEKTNVFFSDRKCGGKRKALVAAEKELKKLRRRLPPPDSSRNKMNVRNVSGRVGVYETNSGPSDSNRDYLAYVASWTDKNGKRRKINFAFNKYGKTNAWKLACFARDNEISDRAEVVRAFERSTGRKLNVKKAAKKKAATKGSKKKSSKKRSGRKKAVKKKPVKKVSRKKKTAKKKSVKKKKTAVKKKQAGRKKKKATRNSNSRRKK